MSLSMRPTLLPQCTSCLRRISNLGLQEWRSGQQIRGKKKLANTPKTVTVRLMKDVPTFGRKGSYVPITIGQMRNSWFPQRTAEYVTDTQLKELKTKNISAERDFQFGVPDPDEVKAREAQAQSLPTRTVEVEKLTPKRTFDLLSTLLPPVMEFPRQTHEVAAPSTEPPATKKDRGFSSAAADLLAAQAAPVSTSTSSATPIFGSVSSSDVANRIMNMLSQADNEDARRIVLGADEVKFVNLSVNGPTQPETDRVKHVGEYRVHVQIKGAELPVERLVRVVPLDSGR